ncbi:PREDICTED: ADP-ribosylation factor-like protein 16-like [Elephantulus edwardii]|uniref:ADP-ribosylation factor-like protein 16-like n=1 Tax=Elephantulus edwardii TaxID=28737 RepID=UPI0003F08523|nr:PREDICTED: ADP-ribosylation factor-like protein 16-like [Elephantulus edwardii]
MCLLLGVTGIRETWLIKQLQKMSAPHRKGDLGYLPPMRPTVGTNLTDIMIQKKVITIRELGDCTGPIWPSYYGNGYALLFMVDASDPMQLLASYARLPGLLSAEQLTEASLLIIFSKIDLSCYVSMEEMKSLLRLSDIIACARQNLNTVEGAGLARVLCWLQNNHRASS